MDKKQKNNTQRRSLFDIISEKLFTLLKNGMFGYFFTSYDEANEKYQGIIKRRKKGIHSGKTRRGVSRLIEKSFFVNAIPRMMEALLRLSLRDYGVIFFVMGAISSVLYPLREKILFLNISFEMFVIGIAICASSIPLLFSSRSLAYNIYTSKLCDSILFNFLGVNKEKMRQASEKPKISASNITFFAGLILGVLSYVMTPLDVLKILGLCILAYSILRTPEIGVIATILVLPFIDIVNTGILIAFVFMCYVIKCIVGKRTFKLEYFDLWVVLVFALTLIRGSISNNIEVSLKNALLNGCLMLSYFLITNLIRSKEWFRRVIIALMISGFITALIALAQVVINKLSVDFIDINRLFSYGQSATASFLSPNALAHFLVAILPFTLLNIISERDGKKKLLGFLICIIALVAMGFTHSLSGIVGFTIAILLLLIIFNRNFSYLALLVGGMLPAFYFTLPENALDKVLSIKMLDGISISNGLSQFREGFKLFVSNPMGTGLTKEIQASSLLIQLLIEYGIIGLIVFTGFALMLVRLTFSYCIKAKNQYRKVNCCAGFCAVTGLVSASVMSYSGQDQKLYLIFWVLVALSFAYMRIERHYEDYKGLATSYTSATMDISLVGDTHHDVVPRRRYVRVPRNKEQQYFYTDIKEYEETSDSVSIIKEFEEEASGEAEQTER